ncbi:hypothetical protein F511_11492 [Dorcoceras hygrometricum]|uniref:Uncharacterized protein n=1 Tax=Dorcoceras hygrometricum TaxID=472368 RepID=A0A2Z7D483_9LAMI|nr:hypothetical protein F511_11492 [Dorcoceras hygrometricum]
MRLAGCMASRLKSCSCICMKDRIYHEGTLFSGVVKMEEVEEEEEAECKTPRNQECQIQAAKVCPPPPRKKNMEARRRRAPPENGYFHSPELDSFFDCAMRRQAWT